MAVFNKKPDSGHHSVRHDAVPLSSDQWRRNEYLRTRFSVTYIGTTAAAKGSRGDLRH